MERKDIFKELVKKKLLLIKPDFNANILEIGIDRFQLIDHKSGDFIVKKGEKCQNIFIAEKSIMRCCSLDDKGEEKTLWIEPEMSFLTEFYCFKSGDESLVDIQLYEDSLVYYISREQLFNLYETFHDWSLLGILFLEELLHYTMTVSHQIHFNNATQNYKLVEEKYLRYLNVVPLKHIASWLNISPVHLSRIRAGNSVTERN